MKTNFITNLKQNLFLFMAVLLTSIGYSQQNQNPTTTLDIGGGKSSDGGLLFDIGGSQGVPRGRETSVIVFSLNTKTDCLFAYPTEIGGGRGTSTDTGQFDNDYFDPFYIGGKSTDGGLGMLVPSDIGGRGSSGDTGQLHDGDDFDGDTGGRGNDLGTGLFVYLEDCHLEPGGRNGSGTSTSGDYNDDDFDIGGRGTTGTGEIGYTSLEYVSGYGCIIDTGGRDSGGGLKTIADTGGKNGTGTTTTGDYDDDNIGGRNTNSTGGFAELVFWLSTDFL